MNGTGMITNRWFSKELWKINGITSLIIGRNSPGQYLILWMNIQLRSWRGEWLNQYSRMIMRMIYSKLNKTHSDLQSMERLKRRQREEEEKWVINSRATMSWKRFICRDSQKRRVTKTFLPLLSQSNMTFDYNKFWNLL